MNKTTKVICMIALLGLFVGFAGGCSNSNKEFEYTCGGIYFERPSFLEKGKYQLALTTQTENGVFYIITDKEKEADLFVNAQNDLLTYLEKKGVELRPLDYFVSDYEDTFSDSANDAAYIGLGAAKTYKQVLVTLQALWGDYTDYGYLYALSNAIAKELKWGVDEIEKIDEASMDQFFAEDTSALNLLYPCFSVDYAPQEVIENCKMLSANLVEDFKLKQVLAKSIEEQVQDFREKVDGYAKGLGGEFVRNECKYAYNGEYMPLKILTTYAEFLIDDNYEDRASYLGDVYSNYNILFETMDRIDKEIITAVEKFDLSEKVEIIPFKCLSSETANILRGKDLVNFYNNRDKAVTMTFLNGYYHEYHHYLSYVINPELVYGWQAEAFSELGRSYSYYGRLNVELGMMNEQKWRDFFFEFTGRQYSGSRDDYVDFYDSLCYACGDYELHWNTGRNSINSITGYLVDLYGEDTVINLYLYPDMVAEVTGKDWDRHIYEWRENLMEKYADCEIPAWMLEDLKTMKKY
ncbi:MAG: hypothetical protein IJW63_09205 [Lachnospiraceae bacterium]|nr:hypothetical protein [Lachnospiraceae bacterium]